MSAVADYLILLKQSWRFLLFGFFLTFTSSAGQTYFIGIFGPEIRNTFSLSHTDWGTIYLAGTLLSALVLPWSGHLIDRINLRVYVTVVVGGLALACITISLVQSAVLLVLAIFLLRQFGQGLTSHTAITSMARYMSVNRGKSIAIASTGYSTGEALLPFLAVVAIGMFGWQMAYQITAVCVLLMLPFILWMLGNHGDRHQIYLDSLNQDGQRLIPEKVSINRGQMLKQWRFYLLLPAVLMPSYVSTAMFFHHLTLAESKGWSPLWITGSYWIYAVFSVVTSLIAGPLIDRFTAARVVPFYLTPMIVGLLVLVPAEQQVWIVPYMILIGVNTGVYHTAINSLWAELFGPKFLGGIKSLIGAFGVFASALGPVTIGVMLDSGYSFEQVCTLFAVLCVGATFLMVAGLKRYTVRDG